MFFSFFFLQSFTDGNFIAFPLYWLIKGLIFAILSTCFPISSWFNTTDTAYWNHLLSFLLIAFISAFFFLSSQENLYKIHHHSDLFYGIYNRTTEHDQRQFWHLFSNESKSSFITLSSTSLLIEFSTCQTFSDYL